MNPAYVNNLQNYPSPDFQWFTNVMLSIDMPDLQHGLFAMEQEMPTNEGGVAIWRRNNRLSTALAKIPLKDLTPPPTLMSAVDVKATVQCYGAWNILDHGILQLSKESMVLNNRAMLFGVQMQEVYDELIRDMLASSASVYNCQSGGGTDYPTPPGLADLKRVRNALERANAPKITKGIVATTGINTAPVRKAWWMMGHSDLHNDLELIPGWIPTINYASSFQSLDPEVGSVIDFRVTLSTLGYQEPQASNQANTVYTFFAAADQAYGMVGMANAMMFRAYAAGGISDPLEQQNVAAWKAWWAPVLLNDARLVRVRCTRTQ